MDDDGASEDEDRLLTREELVQRTLKGVRQALMSTLKIVINVKNS